jgi:protein-disulfide isomerase
VTFFLYLKGTGMDRSALLKRCFGLFFAVAGSTAFANDVLMQYDGRNISYGDLSPAAQQNLYDLEYRYYSSRKSTLENEVLLDLYFDEQAKKTGKAASALREAELKVADPTEKDAKAFYEKNKDRIPYPYDKVKDEIKSLVQREMQENKRSALVEKIKSQKKVKMMAAEPVAPKVKLEVAGFPAKGKSGAKVQIVEFADYQCPHCKHASSVLKKVIDQMKDKVEFVYVDYPINPSGISKLVAKGSHCAGQQGKYWEFHYMAFDKQSTLSTSSSEQFAKDLKLDEKKFKECFDGKDAEQLVERGRKEGERVGVAGTPTIFINGRKANVGHDEAALKAEIEKELKASS